MYLLPSGTMVKVFLHSSVLYKDIKQSFEMSPYLLIIKSKKHGNAIAKLRLSSHQVKMSTILL